MENDRLREVWRVWTAQYSSTRDITERLVAADILDLIREVVTNRVVIECLKDPLKNPEQVLTDLLNEIRISKREFQPAKKKDDA
jgi:hypothetical protein